MRLRALRFAAIVSLTLAMILTAQARPRYGGTIRVQLSPSASTLRDNALAHLTAETLTRLNAAGTAQPRLATSWSSDKGSRRWRFRLREGVQTHEGVTLTPTMAVEQLAAPLKERGIALTATNDGLQMIADVATPNLPVLLADPALVVAGTGPFRKDAANVLLAFEYHWAGRPYVDRIEFLPARPGATSAGAADVWEVPVGSARRGTAEEMRLWSSEPMELLAIESLLPDQTIATALSTAIDREPMTTALTQRRAAAAGGLLPQWISGYAFLFPVARDLGRAKSLLATVRVTTPLVLSYDASDDLAHVVADRVAVNARDVGLSIQVGPDRAAQLRLKRFTIRPNPSVTLTQLGRTPTSSDPEALYAAELALIQTGRIVPIMHVPLVFGFSPRIKVTSPGKYTLPRLPLADVWISQ